MRLPKPGIPTKLNLAIAIPIVAAFAISAAAGIGMALVAEHAKLATASGKVLQDSIEFSTVVDRTSRFVREPGSQQQVEARLRSEIARLRQLGDVLAVAMTNRDPDMVKGFSSDIQGLEQIVLEAMLARGGMTEAVSLFPPVLGALATAAAATAAELKGLGLPDAEAKSEALTERTGNLIDAVAAFAIQPDHGEFEATRRAVSDYADLAEEAAAMLKRGGRDARSLARALERERSKLFGLVTQIGGSSDRLVTVQLRIQDILDHSRSMALVLRMNNQRQSEEHLARIGWWAKIMGVGAILALIVGVLVATGLYLFTQRSIVLPLSLLESAMKRISKGETEVEVCGVDRTDAIGTMAKALIVFRDSMTDIENMRADKDRAETAAAERRRAELRELAVRFQSTVGDIIDTVSSASTDLEHAANSLTSIAEHTRKRSTAAAHSSEHASENARMVATAAEGLDSSIVEIDRYVQESSDIAAEAVDQARQTDAGIARLSQASDKVGAVVNLISAIAQQTNLLALNATIEAARAGDAGRGFSVVAQEVKQLAAQTAAATQEIGTQISGMQAATNESVAAIKQIGGIIGRLATLASTVRSAVHEQGVTTEQIASNVRSAADATAQVSTTIAEVSRGATETDSASSEVFTSARALSSESVKLKLEVERFLSMVRAA